MNPLQVIDETKYFDIVVATRMAATEGDEGLVYAIINKEYGVREHEAFSYVEIMRVAEAATAAIDELLRAKSKPKLCLADDSVVATIDESSD